MAPLAAFWLGLGFTVGCFFLAVGFEGGMQKLAAALKERKP